MDEALNILLIEDNPGDAFLIKFYLEESIFKNARLIHAEFLKTGLDLLSKNAFDVILLDLNLPDSKGMETLEQVLGAIVDSVVIVLTGLSDEEFGVQTVKKGAQDFLVKGQFDGKVLTSSVRYAFERYQLQKKVDNFTDELDENKQQFETAQEIAGLGYFELDLNDKSMHWTSQLYKLLGVTPANNEVNLSNLIKLVDPAQAEALNSQFLSAIEKGQPFTSDFKLKDTQRTFTCKAKPFFNEKKVITKLVGVVQEV